MRFPSSIPVVLVFLLTCVGVARAAGKPADVQTIGGVTSIVEVTAPAAVYAPLPVQAPPASPPAMSAPRRPGAAALAVFGTLPRPEWTAPRPFMPKPADVVTILPAPPGANAPAPGDDSTPTAAESKRAPAQKPSHEVVTSAPRDPAAPAPSPASKEAKR